MKKKLMSSLTLGFCLLTFACSNSATQTHKPEVVVNASGKVTFGVTDQIKYLAAFQQIVALNLDENLVELENGSRWSIPQGNMVKGWEKCKNLVITQNHLGFSVPKYALVNIDLQLAEPVSLIREPTPSKDVSYIKEIDKINNIIVLSDNKRIIVHSSDRSVFNKMNENDRVVIGVNTGEDKNKSPYLVINTANNHFVRGCIVE